MSQSMLLRKMPPTTTLLLRVKVFTVGPYEYIVTQINGDYAVLKRIDIDTDDTILVALALLPLETDEGIHLVWEDLEYRIK